MTIEIYFIQGRSCPFFECDICGGRILDPGMAMCAWLEGDERGRGGQIQPIHVHKGICQDEYEAGATPERSLMTDELQTHFAYLADNTGLSAEDVNRELLEAIAEERDSGIYR